MKSGASGRSGRPLVARLVGLFRSVVPEVVETPFGSLGGFADALGPEPYSLASGYLRAFAGADPEIARFWRLEGLDLAEPLALEDEREEVALTAADLDRIAAGEPDLVAFSTYCWNDDAVRESSDALRRRVPGATLLLGGRATSGEPEALLASLPAVDGLVVGEGELAFREVLRRGGRDLSGIAGVVRREGGEVRSGGPALPVEPLDDIPSPYLEGLLDPPRDGMMVELSRGCPNRCAYCTWSADRRLRFFSAERVEAELRWAVEAGHRHVTVNDSAVNYDDDRLEALVDAVERASPGRTLRLTYNLRHDALTPRGLGLLARLPTHAALLGVETFSPGAMAAVDRAPVDVDRLRSTLEAVAAAVGPPVVSLVLGLPGDDEAGFRRTLETLLGWAEPGPSGRPIVSAVLVSLLQVYRGSALWERRGELGLELAARGIPYLVEGPGWPKEALARAKAELVRRMAGRGETLKAAEAIVLMEAHGGLDPWLGRRRVEALLERWPPGGERQGWTLEATGLMRDTGQGTLLRLRSPEGRVARVLLRRRAGGARGPRETRLYSLSLRAGPVRGAEGEALLELVRDVLLAGEARLAASRRGRS